MPDEAQVDPVRDEAPETDDRSGQILHLVGDCGPGVEGLGEMIEVDAVLHEIRVRVHALLVLAQLLGRADDHVRLRHQAPLQLADLLGRRIGKRAELVDAVIDDELLADRPRDGSRRRQERPADRVPEGELLHRVLHLRAQQSPVRGADQLRSVERNRERREHEEVRMALADSFHRASHLVQHALHVARRRPRPPVADAVHPQDPVLARQDLHRVHLRQRISVPVVREADDVPP